MHGTPTMMMADGPRLRLPIAYPRIENRRIVRMAPLPCVDTECDETIRGLFEQALAGAPLLDAGA